MPAQRVVVVGASAGGIEPLRVILSQLPADFPAAVFVVVHLASGTTSALHRILDRAGPLPATAAREGEPILPGHVYVCVPDRHLLVGAGHVHVRRGPRENGCQPAADPLFRSAAYYYGPNVVGVVLSGALSDGTAGLHTIRRRGGTAIVQAPDDAMYSGMPTSALEHVGADHVLAADDIAPELVRLMSAAPVDPEAIEPPTKLLRQEVQLMEAGDGVVQHDHPGRPSQWPCPDCEGVLWQIDDGGPVRFRCRVGHAWAGSDLARAQDEAIDTALWTALRAVEDRIALVALLATRAREDGRPIGAQLFGSGVEEYEHSAQVLRRMLGGRRSEETADQQ